MYAVRCTQYTIRCCTLYTINWCSLSVIHGATLKKAPNLIWRLIQDGGENKMAQRKSGKFSSICFIRECEARGVTGSARILDQCDQENIRLVIL